MWKTPPLPPLFFNILIWKMFLRCNCFSRNLAMSRSLWQFGKSLLCSPLLSKDWHVCHVLGCEPFHSPCTKRAGFYKICSHPKMSPLVFEQALGCSVWEEVSPGLGTALTAPSQAVSLCHWLHREHSYTRAVSFLRQFSWYFCQLLSISELAWGVVALLTWHLWLHWHHSSAWVSLTSPGGWHSLPLLSFTHWQRDCFVQLICVKPEIGRTR